MGRCNDPRRRRRRPRKMLAFRISSQSRHSERTVRTNASRHSFALRRAKRRANDLEVMASKHLVRTVRSECRRLAADSERPASCAGRRRLRGSLQRPSTSSSASAHAAPPSTFRQWRRRRSGVRLVSCAAIASVESSRVRSGGVTTFPHLNRVQIPSALIDCYTNNANRHEDAGTPSECRKTPRFETPWAFRRDRTLA